jgi:hypothetical protein
LYAHRGSFTNIAGQHSRTIFDIDGQDTSAQVRAFGVPVRLGNPTPEGIATHGEIAEMVHSLNGTEQAFRLIVLRWPNPPPYRFEADRYGYHAVATNREEPASAVIWKHNQRGNSENWHKELKVGLRMEQMPCGQFEANALYFAIGALVRL